MLRPQYLADGGGVLYQGVEVKLGIEYYSGVARQHSMPSHYTLVYAGPI